MSSEKELDARYGDLLAGSTNPALQAVVRDLDQHYRSYALPASLAQDFERALHDQVVGRANLGERRAPRHWLGRVAALSAVAAVLVLAMLLLPRQAEGLSPLLSQAIASRQGDSGLRHVEQARLFQPLDVAQSAEGYVIHLQGAYADANRIILAYTVSGPEGTDVMGRYGGPNSAETFGSYRLAGVTLASASGEDLGMGHYPAFAWDHTDAGTVQAEVVSWDGSPIVGAPMALSLRWSIEAIEVQPKDDGQGAVTSTEHVPGPFVFDFTVPFHPGRVAEPRLTATAGAIRLTLERVVVTPSATRAYLRAEGADVEQWSPWWPTLSGEGWQENDLNAMSAWTTPEGLYVHHWTVALFDKPGPWTLKIPELHGYGPAESNIEGEAASSSRVQPVVGPWEFHFALP